MKKETEEREKYEGFTLSMALCDALPVALFCANGVLLSELFPSPVFAAGAALCALAGSGKAAWKFFLAGGRDVRWLNRQFRFLMPAGFLVMLLSVLLRLGSIDFDAVGRAVLGFPAVLFFALGLAGMVLMGVFARTRDNSARSNWTEQLTNAAAQLMFLIGLILLRG